jgi:hypothetical protein
MHGWTMRLYNAHGFCRIVCDRVKLSQAIPIDQPSAIIRTFVNDFSSFIVYVWYDRKRLSVFGRMCSSHFAHDLLYFFVC